MNLTKRTMLLPVASLLLLGGCASTAGYKKPISDFQEASSVVTQSASIYITQLNKTQRDSYIDQKVSSAEEIKLTEIEALPTFSSEAITARLDALKELSKYGELLGQLANSDTPERISANANELAVSLDKLNKDVATLAKPSDEKFKSAFGPAALLMGEVARFSVEKEIQKSLDKAILDGEKPVTDLMQAIEKDLVKAYELKRKSLSRIRLIYVGEYEEERKKEQHDLVKLRQRGGEIKSIFDVLEKFSASNPSEGIEGMRKAFTALVAYAKSSKEPSDLATLAAQMENFAAHAKRFEDAVHQLQKLNNN
jgi:outer membrane murein-binding lipoprotein Lpp